MQPSHLTDVDGPLPSGATVVPTFQKNSIPNGTSAERMHTAESKYSMLFSTVDLNKSIRKRAVKASVYVMGAEIGSSILRIGSTAVLARLLVPGDFGLLAMVTALTVFAERFKDLGLSDATVQTREITHRQASTLFWINMAICVVIMFLVAGLSKSIAWFYDEPRLTGIALVIATTFLFSGIVIQHQAILRRQLRFGSLALVNLISITLSLLVAVGMAYWGFGYWALVGRELSRAIFVAIGTWVACPWIPARPERGTGISHLISFGKHVTGFNLVHFFSRSLDKILLGRFHGSYWVGLYTNAYHLILLPINQLEYPVKTVALPSLSALQRDPSSFRVYFEKALGWLTFVCMPVVVFLAIFADMVVDLLLGPQWKEAVTVCRILAIGAFADPMTHAAGPVIMALGKTKEYFKLGLINSLTMLCCVAAGTPWGAIGVAAGYSVASYLGGTVYFAYGLRNTPIRVHALFRIMIPALICSLAAGAVVLLIRHLIGWNVAVYWLFVFAGTGATVYLLSWLAIPGGKKVLGEYLAQAKTLVPSKRS
ncbi:MAG: lipopolysaccharide biosynthesis protein [Desulfobacteraceae bacterium]|nr:MAG: lipopolysaccharide biosynthesis protein [Desulfobacteraceae bacterium]